MDSEQKYLEDSSVTFITDERFMVMMEALEEQEQLQIAKSVKDLDFTTIKKSRATFTVGCVVSGPFESYYIYNVMYFDEQESLLVMDLRPVTMDEFLDTIL